jgi:hypothetical protein
MNTVEYAPEYSHAERIRFVVLAVAAGALIVGVCKLWFFPWLREFSASASCRTVFGFSGTAVLFYSVFVGVPLHAALLIGVSLGRRGFRVLRQGRMPPVGERVFRRTPVVRGVKARWLGYVQLFAAIPPLVLSVWGVYQAPSLVRQAERHPASCAPGPKISMSLNTSPTLCGSAISPSALAATAGTCVTRRP